MKSKSLVIDSHDSRKIADSISDALRTIVEQSKDPLVDLSCDGHPEIKVEELENEMICINSGDSSIEIPRNCVLKLADELKKLGNDNDS